MVQPEDIAQQQGPQTMHAKICALTATLMITMTGSAFGYNGLKQDYSNCTTGQGKIANETVVAACSRLINNAKTENETIGLFYALRASANSNKADNCRDAKKARKLINNKNLTDALNKLEKSNC